MSPTLRPSAEAFRKAGWLPASSEVYNEFMKDLTERTCNATYSSQVALLPPLKDFKIFIETNATVYQEFIRMFEAITESVRVFCSRLLQSQILTCLSSIAY